MHPVLFTVGGIGVPTHDFFVAAALTVGLAVFLWESRRRRAWDERLIPVLAGVLIGGAIGGRAASLLNAAFQDGAGAAALAWNMGGRSILGGLSGAYAGALIGKRVAGYPFRTGDLFAPAAALALAVGRWGCFLTEPPGRPTGLPWGIRVDPVAAQTIPQCPGCTAGQAMHPSFLYEIGFLLLAFAALLWLRHRIEAPGELLPLFLAGYAGFRFLVEFTRANPTVALGLTQSQWFLLAVLPLLVWRLVHQSRKGTYQNLLPRTTPLPRREVIPR